MRQGRSQCVDDLAQARCPVGEVQRVEWARHHRCRRRPGPEERHPTVAVAGPDHRPERDHVHGAVLRAQRARSLPRLPQGGPPKPQAARVCPGIQAPSRRSWHPLACRTTIVFRRPEADRGPTRCRRVVSKAEEAAGRRRADLRRQATGVLVVDERPPPIGRSPEPWPATWNHRRRADRVREPARPRRPARLPERVTGVRTGRSWWKPRRQMDWRAPIRLREAQGGDSRGEGAAPTRTGATGRLSACRNRAGSGGSWPRAPVPQGARGPEDPTSMRGPPWRAATSGERGLRAARGAAAPRRSPGPHRP